MPRQRDRRATAHQLIAVAAAGLGLALLVAGSLVHSRQAAGAVPDWPLFYGHWWPRYWNGNAALVNVHRLLAATVTALAISLVFSSRRRSAAGPATRFHSAAAVALVVQVLLGGAIALRLPLAAGVAWHAFLAQIAAILLIIAATHSLGLPTHDPRRAPRLVPVRAIRVARLAAALALLQLALGAFARHPPAAGGYLAILASHVGVAFVLQLALTAVAALVAHRPALRRWRSLAIGLAALIWVQIMLGLAVLLVAPSPLANDGLSLLPAFLPESLPEVSPRFPLFHAGHVVMASVLAAGCVVLARGLDRDSADDAIQIDP